MDLLVLAAGYATRLHPLTLEKPKPLLEVGGKCMLEHVLACFSKVPEIDRTLVVMNEKFSHVFQDWTADYQKRHPQSNLQLINDGSTSDADKLGAIGDIGFAIRTANVSGDLLVIAGDNLFDQSLEKFVQFAQEKRAPVLGVYDVGNIEIAKKLGVIEADSQNRITCFEEKPANPKSTLACTALYYYPASVVPRFAEYLKAGNNPDQPGRFVQWLYPQEPVYIWQVPGRWLDMGSHEALAEARKIFTAPA
jgi:glucose-1-phosphate thymidylyltransferase